MEIKIGEYVRTSKGYIFKIEHNKMVQGLRFLDAQYGTITKHSPNIIDLIEVGDIVHTRDVLNEDIIYIWTEEYLKALKED